MLSLPSSFYFTLAGEGGRITFCTIYYYCLSPAEFFPFFTIYVINTPFPQRVAQWKGRTETGEKKEQNNVFFHQKFPLFPLPQGFPLWATWKVGNNVATQWTPSYHMKHSSSELEETALGEEKSCVIYDIGPCSYTDSPLHVYSKVWPPYVKRFKCGFRKLLSPPFCISLLLTWRFWRREVSRPPLSWLWGTFHIASGVCHCD